MRENLLSRMDQYLNEGSILLTEAGEDAVFNRISAYHLILDHSFHTDAEYVLGKKKYGNQARANKVAQEIQAGRYAQYLDNPTTPEAKIANDFFVYARNQSKEEDKQIRDMSDAAAKIFKFVTPDELQLLKVFMNLRLTKITDNEQLFVSSNAFEFLMKGDIDKINNLDDSFVKYLNSSVDEFKRFSIRTKAQLVACAQALKDEITSHSTFETVNLVSMRKIYNNSVPCYIAVSVLDSIFMNDDGTIKNVKNKIPSGTHLDSGYTVHKVTTCRQVTRLLDDKQYVDWCITVDQRVFDYFVGWDGGYFLIFLKDGYQQLHKPTPDSVGNDYQFDPYSLSMIAAAVSKYGKVLTVTGRWNHGERGYPPIQEPGHLLTLDELEKLVGISLCNVQ